MQNKTARLKLCLDQASGGTVFLDDMDIGHCVNAIEIKASDGNLTEIKLTIHAELDADLTAQLEKIALAKPTAQPAQTVRLADGREMPVRSRAG